MLATILGCSTTENHKVSIKRSSVAAVASGEVAAVTSEPWWRTPYTANRAADNPWDAFVPKRSDPLQEDLNYFRENTVRWPQKMRAPFVPTPIQPKKATEDAIQRRLDQDFFHQREVY